MVRRLPLWMTVIVMLLVASPSLRAAVAFPFDHSEWDQFLKEFVNEKGEVNFRAARKNSDPLVKYLSKIRSIPEEELDEWPREERMTLFINAYNAGVVKAILDHYPVKEVMQIPGIWDHATIEIAIPLKRSTPRAYSPNQIQRDLLLRRFHDEKVLFVLFNGAKDSPPLLRDALVGPQLEGQLYLATRRFVNDGASNRVDPVSKKVILSRLFKWYGSDFLLNWGQTSDQKRWNAKEQAVLSFLAHYLEDPKKIEFLREGQYKVKYRPFDWSLRETAGRAKDKAELDNRKEVS